MTSNINLLEEDKMYKSSEVKEKMGYSDYLWDKEKENIPCINVGSEKRAFYYYNGKDLNFYLRMRVV